MKIFQRLSHPFVVFVERFYPDPFVFVILLSILTFGLVLGITDATPVEAISHWGGGLAGLLKFMAQLSITLITAHALAHTDAVRKGLAALAKIPKTEFQAYFLVVLISGMSNLFAWSLGLVVGAIIARQVALEGDKKGLNIHYPLLVACAYAGFVIWHMGYSSSAALFVATEGHEFEEMMGIIPVTETIFTSWNIAIALITLAAIAIITPLMHPDKKDIFRLKASVIEQSISKKKEEQSKGTFGDMMNDNRPMIIVFGLMVVAYICYWFYTKGFQLNLNIVNWTFLALGMLLARSPKHYVDLISDASKLLGPILLQYPFYAGIMGLMSGSGLTLIVSDWFTQMASAETLTFWAFLSSGLVNMFVPSGGGQWAVQGPVFMKAAQDLGTDPALVVMGVAYGDQWTNMIQPFWTIPLLAIANLDMRKIMGYTFVVLLISLVTLGGGLLILGAG